MKRFKIIDWFNVIAPMAIGFAMWLAFGSWWLLMGLGGILYGTYIHRMSGIIQSFQSIRLLATGDSVEILKGRSRFGIVFEEPASWFVVYLDGSSESGYLESDSEALRQHWLKFHGQKAVK